MYWIDFSICLVVDRANDFHNFPSSYQAKVGHNRASVCGPWPRYLFPVLGLWTLHHNIDSRFNRRSWAVHPLNKETVSSCASPTDGAVECKSSLEQWHLGGFLFTVITDMMARSVYWVSEGKWRFWLRGGTWSESGSRAKPQKPTVRDRK